MQTGLNGFGAMAAVAQPRTQPTGRIFRLLFGVIGAILKRVLYGLLIVAVIVVAGLGVYGQGMIETGVGEVSRLEAARVYLHLMGQKPAWPCWWGYVIGTVGSVVVWPLHDVYEIARGDMTWSEAADQVGDQIGAALRSVFHTGRGEACTFPSPVDWTPELLGR